VLHPVRDLRAFLSGKWRIARRIRDVRQGLVGRLTGHGHFATVPAGLVYDEAGLLRFGTYEGKATRRYLFQFDKPDAARVCHADGSLFHALDLCRGKDEVHHQCAEDHYRGRYHVLDENRFVTSWDVTGPRKRYRAATVFLRSSVQPEEAG